MKELIEVLKEIRDAIREHTAYLKKKYSRKAVKER